MRKGSVWQLDGLPATPTQNLPREKWLELRRSGIGGSDIAGILDISPWSTPLAVYCDKAGLRPDRDPTDAMEFGLRMEPELRRWAKDEINKQFATTDEYLATGGYNVLSSPYLYQYPTIPEFIGNLDGVVINDDHVVAGLEIKTVDRFAGKDWKDGAIPEYYEMQAQWYMGVTGLAWWIIAALIGKRFELRSLNRDQEKINKAQSAAFHFWKKYVVPRIMPEATGDDTHLLLELFADSSEDIIQDENMEETCAEYSLIQKNIKAMEDRRDERKAAIMQRIGDAKGMQAGAYKAIWSRYVQSRVDSKKLKADYPDVYAAVTKESVSGRLTVKGEG